MAKRMTIMVIFLAVLFGAVFGWYGVRSYFMGRFFANFQPPPVSVTATKVQAKTWNPYFTSVGTLKAENGVDVSPEVAGVIEKIYFNSGEMVQKGQPLVKIDDSVELATLEQNEAQLQLDTINYQRMSDLFKKNAASKSQVDTAEANLKSSKGATDKTKALIAQKNIVAPFAGKVGIRLVDLGQYVSPGTALVTLQAIAPIFVDFYLPEQNLPNLHTGQTVKLKVDTYPKQEFDGKITAINAKVDLQTHNILVRATLPNKDQKLYPGLFANIHVILPQQESVLVLPTTAITFSLFGDMVYVVNEDGKDKKGQPLLRVKQHYVKVGETHNGNTIITSGIKAGDLVVTSGQLKLDNDTQVVISKKVTL